MARILVVDDELQLRSAVSRFLKRCGHDVVEAANGREGVAVYQGDRFDLVLMDLVMPVMGGLEAIGRIRSSDPGARIVAQSAGWTENALDPLVVASDLGAAATIAKPYELADLAAVIADQLCESNPMGAKLPAPGTDGRKKRGDTDRSGTESGGSSKTA